MTPYGIVRESDTHKVCDETITYFSIDNNHFAKYKNKVEELNNIKKLILFNRIIIIKKQKKRKLLMEFSNFMKKM